LVSLSKLPIADYDVASLAWATAAVRWRLVGSMLTMMLLASLLSGCGRPFNIKPRPSGPRVNYRAQGEIGGVSIKAETITDEDYLFDNFDANLILAGVYPVSVMVTNNASEVLELKRTKFEIQSAAGERFGVFDARRAYKRLISYYEISLYSKNGYKRSLDDFSSHVFDLKSPLRPGESREGILFFGVPAEAAAGGVFTLVGSRIGRGQTGSLELKLN
jgi:hypothetical protein